MKYSLVFSLLIHVSLFVIFFSFSQQPSYSPSTNHVELFSSSSDQKEREEKVRGSKQRKIKDSQGPLKDSSVAVEVNKGNSQINVKAIKASASGPNSSKMSYAQELQEFIDRNRYYPRRAQLMEQTGIVEVGFRVGSNGEFSEIKILKKAPHGILNRAARNLIQDLKSFKPLPENYKGSREFVIPINYQFKKN